MALSTSSTCAPSALTQLKMACPIYRKATRILTSFEGIDSIENQIKECCCQWNYWHLTSLATPYSSDAGMAQDCLDPRMRADASFPQLSEHCYGLALRPVFVDLVMPRPGVREHLDVMLPEKLVDQP
eukprot:1353610-Amphidinium_carterae.1